MNPLLQKTIKSFKNLPQNAKGLPKHVKNLPSYVKNFIKNKSYRSIRFKLVASFLIMIIPICLVGFISYFSTRSALLDNAISSSISTMEQSKKNIDSMFASAKEYSIQMSNDSTLMNFFHYATVDERQADFRSMQPEMLNKVQNKVESGNTFSDILILTDNRDTSVSTGNYDNRTHDITLNPLKESKWYKELKSNPNNELWISSHPDLDQVKMQDALTDPTRSSAFSYARTIFDNNNASKVNGILVLDFKLSAFMDFLKKVSIGDDSFVHLIFADREISSDGILDSSKNSKNMLMKQDFIKKISSSKAATGHDTINFNGTKYLIVYTKSEITNASLIGMIPYSVLLQSANSILVVTLLLILLGIIIATFMGVYMSMSMGRTINRIINVAGTAAQGDLTINPTSKKNDELGLLTRSIATMITNMRNLISKVTTITHKVDDGVSLVATTSQQVTSVTREITTAIQEISQGASAQAADSEQGVSRMESLSERISHVSSSSKEIEKISTDTMNLTKNGLSIIEDLSKKADETTKITQSIVNDIQSLEAQSKSISKIIRVITGIADQTNLLSFNAAIEAAKAGEAGRGFAVVADEVRKLAEQSMNAAREIGEIIKETQKRTAQTVERAISTSGIIQSQNDAVSTTSEVFHKIADSMNMLVNKVTKITDHITEVEENKNQVVLSIQNISAVSQQTAASSQEVNASTEEQLASVEELSKFAMELKEIVQDLSNAVGAFKV